MKIFLLFFALLSLVFPQKVIIKTDEETHGCTIKEGQHKCCWANSNGCCKPPRPNQACTMVFITCCKMKVYDEETGTYKYEYSHHY